MAKVLIVDDSKTEILRFSRLLEKDGHQIVTAASGEEGIELACSETPDVILMDIVMPGLNGFQATRHLTRNEKTKSIPVIIVTTKNQETDKVWGKRQGASAYLTKPVAENLLLDTVKELLNG
jgi:twitching motility two-component system response regulator PilH